MNRVQKENGVEALYNFWDDKEPLVSIERSAENAALELGRPVPVLDRHPWMWERGGCRATCWGLPHLWEIHRRFL